MKISKTALTGAIILSSLLPSSFLVAQQTTTLGEISKKEREKKIEKKATIRAMANSEPSEAVVKKAVPESRKKQTKNQGLTEADLQSIQKRIDKQKADLKTAKANKSLSAEDIEEREMEIKTAEKNMEKKKKVKSLLVKESN